MPTVIRRTVIFSLLILLLSVPLFAALSPEYERWRSGPVQWIMTSQETRAWKALKSDEEASKFIDLFWARRDPTPGTPYNEFRDEFDARVRLADQSFAEKGKVGSLSDRGRVLITLGRAPNMSDEASHIETSVRQGFGDPTGGHELGARYSWIWEAPDAKKFQMNRVEVVFIQDTATLKVHLDPTRPGFFRAADVAIRSMIVSPDLKEAPEWALHGGLTPKEIEKPAEKTEEKLVVSEAPAPVKPKTKTVTKTVVVDVPPVMVKSGATRLTLVRNASAIVTETRDDPFDRMSPVETFHQGEVLGAVAQYCAGKMEAPRVEFTVKISGVINGQPVNASAPPDEIVPDRLKALPGCYMLRAELPLDGLPPGAYELSINLGESGGNRYDLKKSFRIE